MKIEYKLTLDELLRFYPVYVKYRAERPYLKWILIFLLWQCVISTFIWLSSFIDENISVIPVFIGGNIVLLILWPIVTKEWLRQNILSQAKFRNLFLKRTVEINDNEILCFIRQSTYHIALSDILEAKKIWDFIFIRGIDLFLIIPARAFDSKEDFNHFIEFAKKHEQEIQIEDFAIDESRIRPRPSKPKIILYLVFILFLLSGMTIFDLLMSKDDFWTEPFSGENIEAAYSEFTDNLKDKISPEEWDNTINHWRQKIGPLKKVKVVSSVPYDLELENRKDKVDARRIVSNVIGEKGKIKIVAYFHWVDNDLLLNGFEFIPASISTVSYIEKSDVTSADQEW